MSTTIENFIGKAKFDEHGGGYIWGVDEAGGQQMIAEIRGWGAIQNLFKTEQEAAEFQDGLGNFIAQAINDKIASQQPQHHASAVAPEKVWVEMDIEEQIHIHLNSLHYEGGFPEDWKGTLSNHLFKWLCESTPLLVGQGYSLKDVYKAISVAYTAGKKGLDYKTIRANIIDTELPSTPLQGQGYSKEQVRLIFNDGARWAKEDGKGFNFNDFLNEKYPLPPLPHEGEAVRLPDDTDPMLTWAENDGWVWHNLLWRKEGWKSRTTTELYNGPYKDYLQSTKNK